MSSKTYLVHRSKRCSQWILPPSNTGTKVSWRGSESDVRANLSEPALIEICQEPSVRRLRERQDP